MPPLNFQLHEKPSRKLIKQYEAVLPKPVLDFWRDFGFGSVLNGYLKICNPEDYQEELQGSYTPKLGPTATVFAATAMADLIVWEGNYIVMVDYRHQTIEVLESGCQFFFEDLSDESTLNNNMKWQPFPDAIDRLGEPDFDECYGYVPILAAGGDEKMQHLRRMKLREHLAIITDFIEAI